jgi:DNA-binding NtrC family response regulator
VEALSRRALPNVLIEGETGTGKELLAAAIAAKLGRARVYSAINMAAVPAGVFESHLFGHTANAFSGAGKASRGVLAAHMGGAVFLDELGELPLDLQPKLLRLLENREIHPVGAERPFVVDVLLIAATNRSLEEQVQRGAFRADLFARLASARIELPPLRERAEDIWSIAETLMMRRGTRLDAAQIEVEAVERLLLHSFAYNVRDLTATLERVFSLEPPPVFRRWAVERVLGSSPSAPSSRSAPLSAERIAETLTSCGNNETEAARRLGVTRGKLRRFLSRAHER